MFKIILRFFLVLVLMFSGMTNHGMVKPTKEQLKEGHWKFIGHPRQGLAIIVDLDASEFCGKQVALTLSLRYLIREGHLQPLIQEQKTPIFVSMSIIYKLITKRQDDQRFEKTASLLSEKWDGYHIPDTQFLLLLPKDQVEIKKYFKLGSFTQMVFDKDDDYSKFKEFIKEYAEKFFKETFKPDFIKIIKEIEDSGDIVSAKNKAYDDTGLYRKYLHDPTSKVDTISPELKSFLDKYGKMTFLRSIIIDIEKKLPVQAGQTFQGISVKSLEKKMSGNSQECFYFKCFPRIKKTDLKKLFSDKAGFTGGKDDPLWVILWDGHGSTESWFDIKIKEEISSPPGIGGIWVTDMQDVLDFFNRNIKTEILFLTSCYAGGRNIEYLKHYEKLQQIFNFLLIVQGITDQPVYGVSEGIINFFKLAEAGRIIEDILYEISVFKYSTWYQFVPQILFPGNINFLPAILSYHIKSIGNVLLRVHKEEQKPIVLTPNLFEQEHIIASHIRAKQDCLLALLYPVIIDVPVYIGLLNLKDLDQKKGLGDFFANKDNFSRAWDLMKKDHTFLLDIGQNMFGLNRSGDFLNAAKAIKEEGKQFLGVYKEKFEKAFPVLFKKGLYYDLLKYDSYEKKVRYPTFIPMIRGDDIIQFFSEIKLLSQAMVGENKEKFSFAGILQFLRDAFFDIGKSLTTKRTFLIDKLEGQNDISLFYELERAKAFDKNKKPLEEHLKDSTGRITLEKVRVEVWMEGDSDFFKNVEFVVKNKAWKLKEKHWKKEGDASFGLKWEFVEETDLDQYIGNYRETLKKVLKQAGKTETVDAFLENVHKKEVGKLVSFLKEQEKGFPRFMRSLISRTKTLVSKLKQGEKAKIASELSKLNEIENKTDDQFTIDDKVTLNKIQIKIEEVKEEKDVQKKDPVTKKVDGAVASLDDLKKSLEGLSSTLETIAGRLVKP